MSILARELNIDRNTGKITLKNRMDLRPAMKIAKEMRDMNDGRTANKSMQCIACIPHWLWNENPWLVEARRARLAGNEAEYNKNFRKFLRLFPQFQVAKNI